MSLSTLFINLWNGYFNVLELALCLSHLGTLQGRLQASFGALASLLSGLASRLVATSY